MTKSPKRIKPKEPRLIYLQGASFAATANLIWSIELPHGNIHELPNKFVWICNTSFSIELLLKSLICLDRGDFPKTHQLDTLFSDLKGTTKKIIKNRWDSGNNVRNLKYDQIDKAIGARVTPRSLEEALKQASNAFVQWRYAFELSGNTSFYISGFIGILGEVIYARQPAWGPLFSLKPKIGP